MDARGNKPGVQAEFSVKEERLAFTINKAIGEADDRTVYSRPREDTIQALENYRDVQQMYLKHLPDDPNLGVEKHQTRIQA
ncbi:hypothetical protein EV213_11726 [Aureibacillus halotolerans]|uniref:Uncharacterized protein n=1 Tax=Aureibacillus halotolerans TaxID=1508390 RepID=A0A4R6TV78_9BACI|nr:hypothetical protein EV213_11726 [Aureibacillus halotolerans]